MTGYEYLKKIEACERVVERIYAHLSEAFAEQPRLHQLFKRLAAEEVEHSNRARFLAPARLQDPDLLRDRVAVPDVDGALAQATAALRDVRAGSWGTDPTCVVARAVALEEGFGELHFQAITAFARPELKRLFTTLMEQDRAHATLLKSTVKLAKA